MRPSLRFLLRKALMCLSRIRAIHLVPFVLLMVRFSLSILFAHRQDEPTPAWKLNLDTINSLLACNVDCTPKGSFRELISSSGGTLGRLVYPARNLLTQLMDQIPSRRPGRGRTTRFRQPLDELGDMVLLEKGGVLSGRDIGATALDSLFKLGRFGGTNLPSVTSSPARHQFASAACSSPVK